MNDNKIAAERLRVNAAQLGRISIIQQVAIIVSVSSSLEDALDGVEAFHNDLTKAVKNYYKVVHGEGVK